MRKVGEGLPAATVGLGGGGPVRTGGLLQQHQSQAHQDRTLPMPGTFSILYTLYCIKIRLVSTAH
jgi:hypothetical protein